MKNRSRWERGGQWIRRLLPIVLASMLFFLTSVPEAQASNEGKKTASRAIAIVFDNSGSMYAGENKAWCQATYAIEVFAAMMNGGDTLQVYPMSEVTTNGRTYSSEDPVVVSGGGDISAIRDMYTPHAGDTPIETIRDAYDGLQGTSADEKWLIVLTDGAVFYEDGKELSASATQTRLEEVLNEYNCGVNVLYLGIGNAAAPKVEGSGAYQYYADKAVNSADVLSKLTEMCNMIFGRDKLPSSGRQLTFDVSMKKLILFVQGSDISDVVLKDSAGEPVGTPAMEYSPRYSEQGAGSGFRSKFGVDKSLSGYMAIYDVELDAGTYSLSYSGNASDVSVYYEPDIDLVASLMDESGAVVSGASELYPGVYTIGYGLVDREGNATNSNLLGATSYKVTYSINGEKKTDVSDKNGQIELELREGDVLDGEFNVTYLSGYTITKSASEFGWPLGGLRITPRPAGLLEVRITGGQETYRLSQLEETPYRVELVYEGSPLSAGQLDAAEVSVNIEGGNVGYALSREDDHYALNLKYASAAADTGCGPYTMYVFASYADEYGVVAQSDKKEISFTVEDDGYALSLEVEGDGYYVISSLEDSEPIRVVLSIDGQPLTDELLAAMSLAVDGDGLTCKSEPLYGESAFAVRIVNDGKAQSGHYTLNFAASSRDQIGREIQASGTKTIELSNYPLWLRILVIALIVLAVAAVIWLYLSAKILPKKIGINAAQTVFIVDGEVIEGTTGCKYTGGGKKSGSLQIKTPAYSGSPLVNGGFTLTLQAVSPRRIKSKSRRALVTKITPSNTAALQSLQVGSHTVAKVDDGDGVAWAFDGQPVQSPSVATNFDIGGGAICTYVGETIESESFTLKVVLQFK